MTQIALSAPVGFKQEMKINSDGVYYSDFFNHRLYKDKLSVADLGGPNGDTTTFFTHYECKSLQRCKAILNRVKEIGTNSYSTGALDQRVHIPWTNINVYVDHASTIGGRVFGGYNGTLNQKQVWSYRRNAAWAEIYLNNAAQHTVNNLTNKFISGDVGRFMIGNGNALFENAAMDFYGPILL